MTDVKSHRAARVHAGFMLEATPINLLVPERTSLLGLILRGVLERRLRSRRTRLLGDIVVEGSGMVVTLRFGRGGVAILPGACAARPIARVRGTLEALLDAALGRGRLRAWLAGRLSVRGQPLALLRLLTLLRSQP